MNPTLTLPPGYTFYADDGDHPAARAALTTPVVRLVEGGDAQFTFSLPTRGLPRRSHERCLSMLVAWQAHEALEWVLEDGCSYASPHPAGEPFGWLVGAAHRLLRGYRREFGGLS